MITVNKQQIIDEQFAYDGCHKIYIIEDESDREIALSCDYKIHPISELEEKFNDSCDLKFINNWKLNKTYVKQFEEAIFE